MPYLLTSSASCETAFMMADGDMIEEKRRSTAARIGITALNLLQPGLGLVRIGSGRAGSLLIALPYIWLFAEIGLFATTRGPSFAAIVIFVVIAIAMILALYGIAIVMTWRRSALIHSPLPWWTRWHALVSIAVLASLVANIAVSAAHQFYRPFYVPAESMTPTLVRFDRIIADMRAGRNPAIGDVVLIRLGAVIYIKRVVGLPGDRVSLAADRPIINNRPSQMQDKGLITFLGARGVEQAALMDERLPGEIGSHNVAIAARTSYGDMSQRRVPAGHIFVLGDNRERSVDSRLSIAQDGFGMVPVSDIIGQPLFIVWSSDRNRIGHSVGH